jgi:predicted CXXCH cytochrome family protein
MKQEGAMKIYFITAALLISVASVGSANTIRAYNGNIPFDHKMHRSQFKCVDCHEGAPRYFALTKQTGHKLCIGCHKAQGAGPSVNCSGCHKQDLQDS